MRCEGGSGGDSTVGQDWNLCSGKTSLLLKAVPSDGHALDGEQPLRPQPGRRPASACSSAFPARFQSGAETKEYGNT